MANAIIVLLVLLMLGVGAIILQIFLSKKDNRWYGLILPIISVCISLLMVANVAAVTSYGVTSVQVMDENGVVIQETAPERIVFTERENTSSVVFTAVIVFLLGNIPTVILLAIYFACREGQRKRKALERMQVQDLE